MGMVACLCQVCCNFLVMTVEYICLYFIRHHQKIYVMSTVCDPGFDICPLLCMPI